MGNEPNSVTGCRSNAIPVYDAPAHALSQHSLSIPYLMTVVMSPSQVGSVDSVLDPAVDVTASPDSSSSSMALISEEAAATLRALMLGFAAAAAYSVANLALRGLSRPGGGIGWDMWVAGTKAFPTFFVAILMLTGRRFRGQTTFSSWNLVWPVAVAALFNQLAGNLAFQMSLSRIGLAISVPICFSMIICSGAIVGRFVLGDQVTARTGISIGMMVASIAFLSSAAQSRSVALPTEIDSSVATGVLFAMVSGVAYGVTGVYIRRAVRSQMPVAATLFMFSAAGFLVLCPLSLMMLPFNTIAATSLRDWSTIGLAGTFNAIGFFAITNAMKHLNISRANVINASQNALCAVGAVLVFGESLTTAGLLGIGLTIGGLLILDRR